MDIDAKRLALAVRDYDRALARKARNPDEFVPVNMLYAAVLAAADPILCRLDNSGRHEARRARDQLKEKPDAV